MGLSKEAREYFAKEGRRGGKKRAQNMTAEERKDAARKAVQARWAKRKALAAKAASSAVLALFFLVVVGWAGDKPTITIHVLESHVFFHGYRTTDCKQKAEGQSCVSDSDYPGVTADARVTMPDGSQAMLRCDSRIKVTGLLYFSKNCTDLREGDYEAELKGNTIWVHTTFSEAGTYAPDGTLRTGKQKPGKIKYQIAASPLVPTPR